MKRALGIVLGLLVVAVGAGLFLRPNTSQPDVIFIVLDTVRADHSSLCGYERPTTPVLEHLVDDGWSHTCGMVAPGPWTVPSHASFFTGRSPIDVKLDGQGTTLAEQMLERGYQTVMLSANPVLAKGLFVEGFARTRIAKSFQELDGPDLVPALHDLMVGLDPDRPVFLYVNITDAHIPYPEVPPGISWLPPQTQVQRARFTTDPALPMNRFYANALSADEKRRFLRRQTNGYDYGMSHADRNLGEVLSTLESMGRLSHYRAVITSDHGELLGEHQRIGHGDTLLEPLIRVPLLMRDTTAPTPVELPDLVSGLSAFHLVRDGVLPEQAPPAQSVAWATSGQGDNWNGLAIWASDAEKVLWREDVWERYDLVADPTESNPLPLGAHALRDELESLVERNQQVLDTRLEYDRETVELLRAAGYLE